MKCLKHKSTISATVGGQRVKIYSPGTFDISSVQYDADPAVWQLFVSRMRAVGLQLTQLHPRDQIVLYYDFVEKIDIEKKEEM